MCFKTIVFICFIPILALACSLKNQTQTITVLVKEENSSNSRWSSYKYDDKRKVVFDQNKPVAFDPILFPEPTPEPVATGYTRFDSSSTKGSLKPSRIWNPDSSVMHYNKSGKLEKEEWDVDNDQVMDWFYLYYYNKENRLYKKERFFYDGNESFTDLYIEYYNNGKIKKEIDYDIGHTYYYNNEGQLIKDEMVDENDPYYDSYKLYTYNSGLLIKEEKYEYGESTLGSYSYDDNGRIIEYADPDKTLKFEYDKDGKLIKKTRIGRYPEITFYRYDKGFLVKEESNGRVTKYDYNKNGNLIKKEYSNNDGKIEYQTKYFYETINLY
jgi:YD repeat-containing protein